MRMVLFAISSKLIFTHFIYHTLLFIIPSSFPSYFNSITFITTHICYSFLLSSMFFMHPFPSLSSSQPLQSHSLLSISIPILSFHPISSFPFICYSFFDSSFSHVQWYPRPSLSSLHSVFTHSYAFHRVLSFLLHATDRIHLISSLLILITSLYLLSFSINLDSILCSMYYDLSISFPYLFLITTLSFYSLSFYAYSYLFSPMPIHFIVSHSSIRHHTQLLMSIHSHLNTPYPLSSFMLSRFYSVIHISLHPPSLFYSIFIHPLIPFLYLFIIYSSFFPFIPFHIILSHSILILSFILFHFNTTLLYSSSSLFYKPL